LATISRLLRIIIPHGEDRRKVTMTTTYTVIKTLGCSRKSVFTRRISAIMTSCKLQPRKPMRQRQQVAR